MLAPQSDLLVVSVICEMYPYYHAACLSSLGLMAGCPVLDATAASATLMGGLVSLTGIVMSEEAPLSFWDVCLPTQRCEVRLVGRSGRVWERHPMTSQSNGCTAAAVTKTHQSSRPGSMLLDGGGSPACVPCAVWVVAPSRSPPSTPAGCIIFGGRNMEEYPRGREVWPSGVLCRPAGRLTRRPSSGQRHLW